MRPLRRFALVLGGEKTHRQRIGDVVEALARRGGDLRARFLVGVFEAQDDEVGAVAEPVVAEGVDDAGRAQRDGLQKGAERPVHDERRVPVAPTEGVAGGGDEHVAVLKLHHGRTVAVVGKDVAPGGEGDDLVRARAVIKERVLKGEDGVVVAAHPVEGAPSQPRLQIERMIVVVRPFLLLQKGGNVGAGIGREDARARVHGGVGDEQRRGEQRKKCDDAEQHGEQDAGDALCCLHGRPPRDGIEG